MTITQTVEIPVNHKLIIDVPREIPAGRAILTFTPATAKEADTDDSRRGTGEGCPICAAHRDPVTGEPLYNAETIAAIEEGDAMLRGEIPAKWYNSPDEMWEDLMKDDPDD
jgi:hypothetical protein